MLKLRNPILFLQTHAVVLFPILGIYIAFTSISVGIIFLLILFLFRIKRNGFNWDILIYFFSILIVSLLSFLLSSKQDLQLFLNNSLQIFVIGVLLSYYVKSCISHKFITFYLIVSIVATLIIFGQFLSFYVFDLPFSFYFQTESRTLGEKPNSIFWGRPSSFFLEPAHYAIYVLPAYYYAVIKSKVSLILFFLMGILFSTSTTGFAIALFIGLYFIIFRLKVKYAGFVIPMLLSAIILFGSVMVDIAERNIAKLSISEMSQNIRLFGTFDLVGLIDKRSLLFGLGHNQISNYFQEKNIYVPNYSNSLLMSVFSFGLISLLPLCFLLYRFYSENKSKGYFIILILVMISDQILFNQNFFHLVICIFMFKDQMGQK